VEKEGEVGKQPKGGERERRVLRSEEGGGERGGEREVRGRGEEG